MSVTIRQATKADLEALVPIQKEIQQLHINALPRQYMEVSEDDYKQWIVCAIESEKSEVFVAELNSHIVGYAIIMFDERPSNPFKRSYKYALIDQLAVLSSARRNGVGSELVKKAIERAKVKESCAILLDVLEFNEDARGFYQDAGFNDYSRRMRIDL